MTKGDAGYPQHSKQFPHPVVLKKSKPMDVSLQTVLIILAVIAFAYVLPILIILASRKTSKAEKILWLVAVLFISWFAWIFYALLAPVKKR